MTPLELGFASLIGLLGLIALRMPIGYALLLVSMVGAISDEPGFRFRCH